jgi:hypothetical protein
LKGLALSGEQVEGLHNADGLELRQPQGAEAVAKQRSQRIDRASRDKSNPNFAAMKVYSSNFHRCKVRAYKDIRYLMPKPHITIYVW